MVWGTGPFIFLTFILISSPTHGEHNVSARTKYEEHGFNLLKPFANDTRYHLRFTKYLNQIPDLPTLGQQRQKFAEENDRPAEFTAFCKFLVGEFQERINDLSSCTAAKAKPVEVCLSCNKEAARVLGAYTQLNQSLLADFHRHKSDARSQVTSKLNCLDVMATLPDVNVVPGMFNTSIGVKSLWAEFMCPNCYAGPFEKFQLTERVIEYKKRFRKAQDCLMAYSPEGYVWGETDVAISPNRSEGCDVCRDVYTSYRDYYMETFLESSSSGSVYYGCADLRSEIRVVWPLWNNGLRCHNPDLRTYALSYLLCVLILIITLWCVYVNRQSCYGV